MKEQQDVVSLYFFRGQNEAAYRHRLENQTRACVDRMNRVCELTAEQQDKLEFAVRGDLARFFRELSALREKTKDLDPQNQADMQRAWQLILPLYQRADTGILDEQSLFDRVLDSLLSDAQQAKYSEYLQQKRQNEIRAIIRVTISDLEKQMPLTQKQRQQLVDLLEKQPPPQRIGDNMEAYAGYMAITKASSKELASILDEHQMKVIQELKTQYAGFAR